MDATFSVLLLCFLAGSSAARIGNVYTPPAAAESDRIIGGVPTTTADFPYQVSLRYNGRHICGGSIITSSHILTAAHCIISNAPSSFSVQAGSTSLGQPSVGQTRAVTRLAIHPQYSADTNRNDIAVLTLATPFSFAPDGPVAPIALADPTIRLMAGDQLVITGWGSVQEGGASSTVLRTAIVPAVALAQCRNAYGTSAIADTMVCAGQSGKDTCQGDSGGPLATATDDSSRILIGVTSFGYGCGRAKYPGVYSRVSSFRTFIRTHAGV